MTGVANKEFQSQSSTWKVLEEALGQNDQSLAAAIVSNLSRHSESIGNDVRGAGLAALRVSFDVPFDVVGLTAGGSNLRTRLRTSTACSKASGGMLVPSNNGSS